MGAADLTVVTPALRIVGNFISGTDRQTAAALAAGALPALVPLLSSPSNVVHSYAALALERLLTVREAGGALRFAAVDLLPLREPLLGALFGALQLPDSAENEYVVKAIMRLLSLLGPESRGGGGGGSRVRTRALRHRVRGACDGGCRPAADAQPSAGAAALHLGGAASHLPARRVCLPSSRRAERAALCAHVQQCVALLGGGWGRRRCCQHPRLASRA
jgi:hypothetical protein